VSVLTDRKNGVIYTITPTLIIIDKVGCNETWIPKQYITSTEFDDASQTITIQSIDTKTNTPSTTLLQPDNRILYNQLRKELSS
jgi:hypothetical protein